MANSSAVSSNRSWIEAIDILSASRADSSRNSLFTLFSRAAMKVASASLASRSAADKAVSATANASALAFRAAVAVSISSASERRRSAKTSGASTSDARSVSISVRRLENSSFCAAARVLRSAQPAFSRVMAWRRCVRRSISRARLLTEAAASATEVRWVWASARAASNLASMALESGSASFCATERAKRPSVSEISRSRRAFASSRAERFVTCSFWRRSALERLSRSVSTIWRAMRTEAMALFSASTAALTASLAS